MGIGQALAVAAIGALSAAVTTLLIQAYLGRLQTDVALINDRIADIVEIQKLACEYWLSKGKDDRDEELAAAARLRGALDASRVFEEEAKRLFSKSYPKYLKLDGALFDEATAAPFEEAGRPIDTLRAVATIGACHDLRRMLRAQRRKLYGAR